MEIVKGKKGKTFYWAKTINVSCKIKIGDFNSVGFIQMDCKGHFFFQVFITLWYTGVQLHKPPRYIVYKPTPTPTDCAITSKISSYILPSDMLK